MIRLRHGDEWVGALVVLAALLFAGAVLHAGLLRDWFKPIEVLRVNLPAAGVAGLAIGADIEVLGIHAGQVRRIVINPNQQIYAEAEIDEQAEAFIRRDSAAVIKRRFGIAGAAYIELSRGSGPPMDWHYAVVDATTERDPTEGIGALVDQLREKIFPILDDVGHVTHSLAAIVARVENGQGDIGRLVSDDRVMRDVEGITRDAHEAVLGVGRLVTQLEGAARDVAAVTQSVRARDDGVPALLRRSDRILASLEGVTRDIATASERLPQIARNVESGSQNLPALLTQLQLTAQQLEQLAAQLRGLWLLGGDSKPVAGDPPRLPSTQVRP
jgi:phospholipid/cholesterol/gamma-HCH transport system substrate-binding protein